MYQDKIAKSFHEEGVYIQEVKTSLVAERAENLPNDISLEINGFPIKSTNDFFRVTGDIRKGDPILFVIFRNGNTYYLSTRVR
jgi:serine protease Do